MTGRSAPPLSIVRSLLPLIPAQLYTLWLVASAQARLLDIVLMNAVEACLAIVATALFFSPQRTVAERARFLFGYFALLPVAVIWMWLASLPPTAGHEFPADRFVAEFGDALQRRGFVLYLAIVLGSALAAARLSGAARQWWSVTMLPWAQATALALICFVVPVTLLEVAAAGVASVTVRTLILVSFLSLTRAFTLLAMLRIPPQDRERWLGVPERDR